MGHHSGQYACSVLPPCLRSFCCWHRRTCRQSEGGEVFLSPQSFLFVPVALETLRVIAPCSLDFLTEVGRWLSAATGEQRDTLLMFLILWFSLSSKCPPTSFWHVHVLTSYFRTKNPCKSVYKNILHIYLSNSLR